jgi:hypothetical protein
MEEVTPHPCGIIPLKGAASKQSQGDTDQDMRHALYGGDRGGALRPAYPGLGAPHDTAGQM